MPMFERTYTGRDEWEWNFLSALSFRLLARFLLFPEKLQQSTVHLLCVCPGYAVRPILYHQQAGSLDRLGGPESRGGNATSLAPASSASVFSASRSTKKVTSVAVT
jgi:hypothetical protein